MNIICAATSRLQIHADKKYNANHMKDIAFLHGLYGRDTGRAELGGQVGICPNVLGIYLVNLLPPTLHKIWQISKHFSTALN